MRPSVLAKACVLSFALVIGPRGGEAAEHETPPSAASLPEVAEHDTPPSAASLPEAAEHDTPPSAGGRAETVVCADAHAEATECEVLRAAEQHTEAGAYGLARLEYKRHLFLRKRAGEPADPEAHRRLSRLDFESGDYETARLHLDAYLRSREELDLGTFVYDLELLRRQHDEGLLRFRLFSLALREDLSPRLREEVIRWNLHLFARHLDTENLRHFLGLARERALAPEETLSRIEDEVSDIERHTPKSARLARGLSIAIPGAGQLYAGHPGDALNAFLLSAAFLAGGTYAVMSGNYLDVSVLWLPGFWRYYQGNLRNAHRLTERRNRADSEALSRSLLDLLREEIPLHGHAADDEGAAGGWGPPPGSDRLPCPCD